MTRIPLAVAVTLGVCLLGCGQREDASQTPPSSRLFNASYERAWNAAKRVLTETGYTISSADQARGLLVAQRNYQDADVPVYADDPVASVQAMWGGLEARMIVSVKTESAYRTRIAISTTLVGRANPTVPDKRRAGAAATPLRSNGKLERELWKQLYRDLI